jgi:NTE family protein
MDFLDREKRPWLHLVNGGIADNLGLRSFWTQVSMAGGPDRAFPQVTRASAPQILLILVNAIKQKTPGWVRLGNVPSLPQVLGSVTSIQMARYDIDTIELVHKSFEKWSREISTPERPVSFDFVEVSFDRVRDDAQRKGLNEVSTSFAISDEQVDSLISAGRQVLRESPEFQSFLERNRSRGTRP